MFPKLRKSVTGFVGNSVRLLFGQLPAHHHHHGGGVGVVKLSLSHFIIRKAVEPSHSLRGKREGKKKKKKLLADCIIQHWQQFTLSPTPKT